jgi:hypothetical protein
MIADLEAKSSFSVDSLDSAAVLEGQGSYLLPSGAEGSVAASIHGSARE